MNPELDLKWTFASGDAAYAVDPVVFTLLRGVQEGGHLNFAARQAGVSYRHAWGLLRNWEQRLGAPLIAARRGRGAQLTGFGAALLDVVSGAERELAPALERVALEAAARLSEARGTARDALSIVSSHGDAVTALRDVLAARHRVQFDVAGSESALRRYRRGETDIAGFHLPLGDLGRTVASHLIALLDGERDRVWLLDQRTLGILSRDDCPVRDFASLVNSDLRFVNRQPGSGTRLIIDGMLGQQGLPPGEIAGYGNEEFTHTAVAAVVASGAADAGFATAQAAASLDLRFEALVEERFYLVCARDTDRALVSELAAFCADRARAITGTLKDDEYCPSVAVLKRVHRAGFWKRGPQGTNAAGRSEQSE